MRGIQMLDESSNDKFTEIFIQISKFNVDKYVYSILFQIMDCTVCFKH
jgi:hypothetical protein